MRVKDGPEEQQSWLSGQIIDAASTPRGDESCTWSVRARAERQTSTFHFLEPTPYYVVWPYLSDPISLQHRLPHSFILAVSAVLFYVPKLSVADITQRGSSNVQ